jgi:hypothetical protein
MSRFEDRLWAELVERHTALAAQPGAVPARRRTSRAPLRRLLPIAVTALIAAVAIVLAGGLGSGGGTPAYAVTQNPDGTVTVTIRELVGVEGADNQLETLGVPVRVAAPEAGCVTSSYTPVRLTAAMHATLFHYTSTGPRGVQIDPAAIPVGDTLLLSAREAGQGVVALAVTLYRGQAPPCLPPGPAGTTAPATPGG